MTRAKRLKKFHENAKIKVDQMVYSDRLRARYFQALSQNSVGPGFSVPEEEKPQAQGPPSERSNGEEEDSEEEQDGEGGEENEISSQGDFERYQ